MKSISMVVLGLVLMACQSPESSQSSGPPYKVTYRNTTVSTTGTVPVDTTVYQPGDTVTVLGNTGHLSWPPFTFDSWNTKNNGGTLGGGGGTRYREGDTFVIHANVVLYGTWLNSSYP